MSGDLIVFLAGAMIGLAFAVAFLFWRREDLGRGWRLRRAELFEESSPIAAPVAGKAPRRSTRRLAIVVAALAFLACGAFAIQTSEASLRAINLVCCLTLAFGIFALVRSPSRG